MNSEEIKQAQEVIDSVTKGTGPLTPLKAAFPRDERTERGTPAAQPDESSDPSPKYEQFNDWSQWTNALAEWVYKQADKGDMSAGRLACVFDVVEFQTKQLLRGVSATGETAILERIRKLAAQFERCHPGYSEIEKLAKQGLMQMGETAQAPARTEAEARAEFEPLPLPSCSCGKASMINMWDHEKSCALRQTYEHNCMVTHSYYKRGWLAKAERDRRG